ncbi:MAG: glycosyltransferase [Xenococcaceae cyanobacterium]
MTSVLDQIMPLISVIIPAFNAEKTIRETTQSVLDQTFSDFEVIVINDGSSDATAEIVSQFNDSRIKIFSHTNAGLAKSRNWGIANSIGKYLAFLDADDLWTPDKLEAQFRALEENSQAAVAYSWTNYIDENGKFLYPGSYTASEGNVYDQLLLNNFLENGSNPLIRRDAIEQVGVFDESLIAAEDWDLWLRFASQYQFICVPIPQVLYRQPINSLSADVVRQERESLKVIQKNFAQAPASLQYLKSSTLSNLYLYLTLKGLTGQCSYRKNLTLFLFLLRAVGYSPTLLRERTKLLAIIASKIVLGMVLSPKYAEKLLKQFKS